MKRRKWKPEQKALIVLEGLKGRPIGELCAEHEISQAQYYQWRDLFLANAAKAFEPAGGVIFRRPPTLAAFAGAMVFTFARLASGRDTL